MALPAPENYTTWQDYARALVVALSADDPTVPSYNQLATTEIPPAYVPPPIEPGSGYPPDGYEPVWLKESDATLYLGNPYYNPPTAPDLFQIDTVNLLDTAVTTSKIRAGAVDNSRLADLAVDASKLANSSVTSTKIANLAVGTAAIQALAVGSAQIADAAILTAKIGDAQIVTAKIADLAVNDAKIANLAVTSAKIANLAVGTAAIQDAAITNAKIANLAVGSAQIQDAAITNVKIGNTIQSNSYNPANHAGWLIDKNGNISGQSINIYDTGGNLIFGAGGNIDWGRITGVNLQINATAGGQLGIYNPTSGSYTDTVNLSDAGIAAMAYLNYLYAGNISTYIAAGAIGTALIANAAIGSAQIADASIQSADIGNGQILYANIGDAQVGWAKIANASIAEAHIADGQITNAKIGYASIDNSKIQDGTIANAKIGNLQVDSAKIADLTVGTQKIVSEATTQVVTFYAADMGSLATSNAWNYLQNGGNYAMVSMYKSLDNQQCIIRFTPILVTPGGLVSGGSWVCMRHDGVYMSQQYYTLQFPNTAAGFRLAQPLEFVDPNPLNGTNNYYIQYNYYGNPGNSCKYTTVVGTMIRR
jgi:hypothetical protein